MVDALKDTNRHVLASDIESSLLIPDPPIMPASPLVKKVQVIEQQILESELQLEELMGADSHSDNEGI